MKEEIITGLIFILAGCLSITLNNYFAKKIIEAQNTAWGFNFGKKEIAITRFVIIIVGFFFILFGFMKMGLF